MPGSQVDIILRTQIVQAVAQGMSIAEVAQRSGRSLKTVYNIWNRWSKEGTVERQEGSGRKRKTTAIEDRQIVVKAKRSRFITCAEIREEIHRPDVSLKTIARRIKESGEFASYWAVKKPFISETNRNRRLQWCQEHKDYTVEQWRRVIWTDESPYVLRFKGPKRVWRSAHERYDSRCLLPTLKHDEKIMVWGCFSGHGVGDLHLI